MNDRIAKLYDQALVLESNGDYVAGELDPVKFAELIVRECIANCADLDSMKYIANHFGIKVKGLE